MKEELFICKKVRAYHSDPDVLPVVFSDAYIPIVDGQKRVALTRPEFEELAYYFFDLGVNGHMRQHYDHQEKKHLFDEDLRDSKICEVFGEEYIP